MSKKKRKGHKNKTRLTENEMQKPAHGRRANRLIFIAITISLVLGTVAMGASSWGS